MAAAGTNLHEFFTGFKGGGGGHERFNNSGGGADMVQVIVCLQG